jgi:hypothetical protein
LHCLSLSEQFLTSHLGRRRFPGLVALIASLAGPVAPQITTLSLSDGGAPRDNGPGRELIIASAIGVLSIRLVYPRRGTSAAHVLPLDG